MIERAIEKSLHERRTMRVTHHLPKQSKDTLDSMAIHFCEYFEIPFEMLRLKSSRDEIVEYKRLFIAHANPIYGPKKVSVFMGYKDHSTVIHHNKKHNELVDEDADYRYKYLKFKMSL